MRQAVFEEIRSQAEQGKTALASFEAEGKVWQRKWTPRERLILLGAGHIALPLCQIGALLDFSVTVLDDRPSFANHLRFPQAETVICDGFCRGLEQISPGPADYVCVITRGHRYDGECLRQILKGSMPAYLGMIGSRRRVAGMMEELEAEGFDRECLKKICAPIGLPIGGQTTAEIAVSIAAQLVEYRAKNRRQPGESACLPQTNVDEAVLKALSRGAGSQTMALIVETKGSTPAKAGSMMAVDALGRTWGTIGGGCGEAEVIREARLMAGKDQKKLMTVNMTNETAEEEGMVCGGVMTVLLESIV